MNSYEREEGDQTSEFRSATHSLDNSYPGQHNFGRTSNDEIHGRPAICCPPLTDQAPAPLNGCQTVIESLTIAFLPKNLQRSTKSHIGQRLDKGHTIILPSMELTNLGFRLNQRVKRIGQASMVTFPPKRSKFLNCWHRYNLS